MKKKNTGISWDRIDMLVLPIVFLLNFYIIIGITEFLFGHANVQEASAWGKVVAAIPYVIYLGALYATIKKMPNRSLPQIIAVSTLWYLSALVAI
jgi:hypothetical protein